MAAAGRARADNGSAPRWPSIRSAARAPGGGTDREDAPRPPNANEGIVVASALIIWKTLCLFLFSESPIVVVLSESMSPGFERGASAERASASARERARRGTLSARR